VGFRRIAEGERLSNSVEACLILRRHQRHVTLERWPQFKSARLPREIPQSKQPPIVTMDFCDRQFITRDQERGSVPAVGRFHLDQPISTIDLEASNIVTCTVAVDVGYPADLLGEVISPRGV
jgi:hypothetical protein